MAILVAMKKSYAVLPEHGVGIAGVNGSQSCVVQLAGFVNADQRRFGNLKRSVRSEENSAARKRGDELRNSVRSVNASRIEHHMGRLRQLFESRATRTEVENLHARSRNLPDNICQRSKIDIRNLQLRVLRTIVFNRRRNLNEEPSRSCQLQQLSKTRIVQRVAMIIRVKPHPGHAVFFDTRSQVVFPAGQLRIDRADRDKFRVLQTRIRQPLISAGNIAMQHSLKRACPCLLDSQRLILFDKQLNIIEWQASERPVKQAGIRVDDSETRSCFCGRRSNC